MKKNKELTAMRNDFLFYGSEITDHLKHRKAILESEISGFEPNYILSVSEHDLCQTLLSKHSLEVPSLKDDKKYADQHEIDVNVATRNFGLRSQKNMKGTQITISIPFEGDAELFGFGPPIVTNPPRGRIVGQELHLAYTTLEHDPEQLKKEIGSDVKRIKGILQRLRGYVDDFNNSLEPMIQELIAQRKQKLLADQGLVGALGIPLKRREDFPQTYSVPARRKEPEIIRSQATVQPFQPEPALDEEFYEAILRTIFDMAMVMERSPSAFSDLDEEAIRFHFLIPLNGQYGTEATAETFNFDGKTDILMRIDGKNIFIAECKFWRGRKTFLGTIDQLLGYTSWRDTKTALLLFSRQKDFSAVLDKIDPAVKTHSCYKREHTLESPKLDDETTASYVFHQPNDPDREVILTVMAFHVPS